MKKLEKIDLEKLQLLKEDFNNISILFGEISISRLILDEKEQNITKMFKDLKQKEQEIKQEIVSKYGDNININIETGEY